MPVQSLLFWSLMDTVRTEHSAAGVAAFLLAVIPGFYFALFIWLLPVAENYIKPGADTVAFAPYVLLLVLVTVLSEIMALTLGIAGALQYGARGLSRFWE